MRLGRIISANGFHFISRRFLLARVLSGQILHWGSVTGRRHVTGSGCRVRGSRKLNVLWREAAVPLNSLFLF